MSSSIADFFKDLFSISKPTDILTFDDALEHNKFIINKVVNDIITGFLEEKNNDHLLLDLIDPVACNEATLFLSSTLEDQFNKYPVGSFDDSISISKKKTSKACTYREACSKVVNEQILYRQDGRNISKGDLCLSLASHYIKILNLLGALLVAISPDKNMCIERFNSIYKLITTDTGEQAFDISVCTAQGRKTIKSRLLEETGIRELINLYILDQLDKVNTQADIEQHRADYNDLITKLNESELLSKRIYEPEGMKKQNTAPFKFRKQNSQLDAAKLKNNVRLDNSAKPLRILSNTNSKNLSSIKNDKVNVPAAYKESEVRLLNESNRSSTTTYTNQPVPDKLEYNNTIRVNNNTRTPTTEYIYDNIPDEEYNEPGGDNGLYGGGGSNVGDKQDNIYRFLDFVKRYRQYLTPEVKQYFSAIINNSFLDENDNIDAICNNSGAQNKNVQNGNIIIEVDTIESSKALKLFFSNFEKMKLDYFNSCNSIIDIIQKEILETVQDGKKITYVLRQMDSETLKKLQTRCRDLLLDMYLQNHANYSIGLTHLAEYYSTEFVKKSSNANPNANLSSINL